MEMLHRTGQVSSNCHSREMEDAPPATRQRRIGCHATPEASKSGELVSLVTDVTDNPACDDPAKLLFVSESGYVDVPLAIGTARACHRTSGRQNFNSICTVIVADAYYRNVDDKQFWIQISENGCKILIRFV